MPVSGQQRWRFQVIYHQDMQIVDDGIPAQVEEILAHSPIAGTSPLPPTNMGQRMLNGYLLTEFGSTIWCPLSLSHQVAAEICPVNMEFLAPCRFFDNGINNKYF